MFGHTPFLASVGTLMTQWIRRTLLGGLVAIIAVAMPAAVNADIHSSPDIVAAGWTAKDASTLRRAGTRLVSNRLAVTFDSIENRVPVYGDWVYGWLSSIWISFDILVAGTQEAGSQIYQNEALDIPAIRHRIEDYVTGEFERQVIAPEITERRMIAAWTTTVDRIKDMDRRLAEEREKRIRALAETRGIDNAPLLQAYAQPLLADWMPDRPPSLRVAPTFELLDPPGGRPGQAGLVLTRSLRPLATRILSVGTRFVIVPLVGGAILIPGVDPTGFVGTSAMTTLIVAGLWGSDYVANWIDEALNRPQFEADLKAAIRAARARTIREAQGHVARSFCAGTAPLPDC